MTLHRDESGMVGKIIVIWLLLVALLGVVAMDAGSIMFTTFAVSDAAQTAAVAGATSYRNSRDVTTACQAAREAVPTDENFMVPKAFCKVDSEAGEVTITLRKQADTLIAGRLGLTEDLTKIEIKETGRPSTL
jgi:Tfp pilus assembly protein PilV